MSNKKTSKTLSSGMDTLNKIRSLTNGFIYGTDQKFHDQNDEDLSNIKNTISKIKETYKQTTGDDIVEFYNRLSFDKNKDDSKNGTRKLVNINDLVNNPENPIINDILFLEQDRLTLYSNYQLIYDHIPQMAQALETYVDNILSPDDFSKDVFNLTYNDKVVKNIDENDIDYNDVVKNLKNLSSKYNIEEKASNIIKYTLMKGDQFVAILKLEKEFSKMISEQKSADLFNNHVTSSEILNLDLNKEEINALKESGYLDYIFNETNKEREFLKNEKVINESQRIIEYKKIDTNEVNKVKSEISKLINENFELSKNHDSLLEDNMIMKQDFNPLNPMSGLDKDKQIKINGSVIKVLEPERVIKLELDDVVYGYYYIEKISSNDYGDAPTNNTYSSNISKTGTFGGNGNSIDTNQNIKQDLITNIFVKGIAEKINKKFILKNKDFKYYIHSLLKQKYILDKKVKITYLSPDEVVHFTTAKTSEYGDSIYRKILFIAKLYLAVLTSMLMTKLIRSHDKRIFYIEIGLDNDSENAVQSFVRDIKNKELKLTELTDLNTVLNNPSQFSDYYMPVINGEKPVEIDTISGMNADMDNDFLEYLLKAMLSGIGIPGSFLNYSDEIEFMRSLAMQNGKFVRCLIHLQKEFGNNFSKVYRALYKNEYMYEEEDSGSKDKNKNNDKTDARKKNDKLNVSYDKIKATFPPPSSLNMTTLLDQINNGRDIIEFILSSILGDSAEDEDKTPARRAVAKELIPSVDWDKYEKIINSALSINKTENALKKANTEPEDTSTTEDVNPPEDADNGSDGVDDGGFA